MNKSTRVLEAVVRPRGELSTSALIDKMFEGVLQAAEEEEEERGTDPSVCQEDSRQEGDTESSETELKLKSPSRSLGTDEEGCDIEPNTSENLNEEEDVAGEGEEKAACNEDDFLSLPPSCILSPLSKSVEAVVTPMVSKFTTLINIFDYKINEIVG